MTKLTNLIEIEPAANHAGNKTLSAIHVIHGAEHTCGDGKHIVPVKTSQVSENGSTAFQPGSVQGFSCCGALRSDAPRLPRDKDNPLLRVGHSFSRHSVFAEENLGQRNPTSTGCGGRRDAVESRREELLGQVYPSRPLPPVP